MLDNMNLSDLKKEPLRRLGPHKKREMLTMHNKTNTRASNRFDSPGDYIYHLSRQNVSIVKKLNCIESLRVALTSNSLEWVQEFGNKGLKLLLGVIKECLGSPSSCEKLTAWSGSRNLVTKASNFCLE